MPSGMHDVFMRLAHTGDDRWMDDSRMVRLPRFEPSLQPVSSPRESEMNNYHKEIPRFNQRADSFKWLNGAT